MGRRGCLRSWANCRFWECGSTSRQATLATSCRLSTNQSGCVWSFFSFVVLVYVQGLDMNRFGCLLFQSFTNVSLHFAFSPFLPFMLFVEDGCLMNNCWLQWESICKGVSFLLRCFLLYALDLMLFFLSNLSFSCDQFNLILSFDFDFLRQSLRWFRNIMNN